MTELIPIKIENAKAMPFYDVFKAVRETLSSELKSKKHKSNRWIMYLEQIDRTTPDWLFIYKVEAVSVAEWTSFHEKPLQARQGGVAMDVSS